jgi:hypothetical protein
VCGECPAADNSQFPAVIAAGRHLFPFRTEKLSPPAPMVLGGKPPGRVGRRRLSFAEGRPWAAFCVHAPGESSSRGLHQAFTVPLVRCALLVPGRLRPSLRTCSACAFFDASSASRFLRSTASLNSAVTRASFSRSCFLSGATSAETRLRLPAGARATPGRAHAGARRARPPADASGTSQRARRARTG